MKTELDFEIELVTPPKDFAFCLQRGKDELVDPVISTGRNIAFQFSLSVGEGKNGTPNFLGPFAQGTTKQRFVYICSGKRAGQSNSCWDRRAKIHLSSIDWSRVREASSKSGTKLKAKYQATGRDGGPSCATVPLLGNGWEVCCDGET